MSKVMIGGVGIAVMLLGLIMVLAAYRPVLASKVAPRTTGSTVAEVVPANTNVFFGFMEERTLLSMGYYPSTPGPDLAYTLHVTGARGGTVNFMVDSHVRQVTIPNDGQFHTFDVTIDAGSSDSSPVLIQLSAEDTGHIVGQELILTGVQVSVNWP